VIAVTSFSREGYEIYGRKCLETLHHWPCKFIVYYEHKPDFEAVNIEYRFLYDIEGIRAFLEKLKSVDGADGTAFSPLGEANGNYDYRFDASRFCRKVFCMDALFDEDKEVFWLDADTVTKKPIPAEFLKGLIRDDPFCYLGRANFCSETGFLGFNTEHKDFRRFRNSYLPTYTSGAFMNLRTWEDAVVFDHARRGIKGNNLNHTALQGIDHPWPHTVLGQYMDHAKGNRKLRPETVSGVV
jgi:hypothetical protein